MLAGGLVLVFVEQTLRRCVRIMRHHRRIPDQERLLLLLCLADEVIDRLHRLAADVEPCVTMSAAVRHAMREAATIKTLQPPLTRLHAQVALLLEHRRQRARFFEMLAHHFASRFKLSAVLRSFFLSCPGNEWRVVTRHFVLMRIQSRDDRRQTRTAQAASHITTAKRQTLARQLVQIRRFDILIPHEAVIAPQMVIRNDHHNVRRRIGSRNKQWQSQQGEKKSADHEAQDNDGP